MTDHPDTFGTDQTIALPDFPTLGARTFTETERRHQRIYATCRWAGVIAITEMSDGFDAAMRIVEEGPARFLPDDEDWGKINETARIGIAFIEGTDQ